MRHPTYKIKIKYVLLRVYICEWGPGERWIPLDSEVVMENGQISCTKNPTGHSLLIAYRFEMPCGK